MQDSGAKSDIIVRIENLTKDYGLVKAVDDVSLTIERGDFLTLLGASGSGKTTILMSIAGFVRPSHGRIFVEEKDITNVPPNRRGLGMVFQGYALFPHMTVRDNVGFPLRVRYGRAAMDPAKIEKALALVQMEELVDRMPDELSGGQQQRVALARALVFEPSLLLLDEPLSALDKKLRADLQWELKDLHQRLGTTFVYVTHDQDEALSMSDHIVILRDGHIEQIGAPKQLYHRPRSHFVADFLGKSNFIDGRVVHRDGGDLQIATETGETYIKTLLEGEATAPSKPQLLALRPENISVAAEAMAGHNSTEGEIAAVNFYGSDYHFIIATRSIGKIVARTHALNTSVEPRVGGRVVVNWRPEDWVIVDPS